MSDDVEFQSPIPWGLVEHVHRTKTGKTTLQISLSIEARALLAQAALDLGCSKLALIRTAISQFLVSHEKARTRGQEQALAAVIEASIPVPSVLTVLAPEPPVLVPEPEPEPEPMVPESVMESTPEPLVVLPSRKRSKPRS